MIRLLNKALLRAGRLPQSGKRETGNDGLEVKDESMVKQHAAAGIPETANTVWAKYVAMETLTMHRFFSSTQYGLLHDSKLIREIAHPY